MFVYLFGWKIIISLSTVLFPFVAGDDYYGQDQQLIFEAVSSSVDVVIPLINDVVMEDDEMFTLSLQLSDDDDSVGVVLGPISTATVTIADDDGNF